MRIKKMTATFGKLEQAELSLEPGLNVIHAPNEWGKSTWCAFLMAMLYGIDTRSKTTKNALADKEHFAPWSGSPMSGRMEITWQGRDITIERSTSGRIPMGDFRAYETDSGLPVAELTASNCGEVLLGVEQSVFRRAGFIRQADLPVTQDEALRRRLNALVTTGDESGQSDRLAQQLKELKNTCKYNRAGMIPQAKAKLEELNATLRQLEGLEAGQETLRDRMKQLQVRERDLMRHMQNLACDDADEDSARVRDVRAQRDQAEETCTRLERICAKLPTLEQTQRKLQQLKEFSSQWSSAMMEQQLMPQLPGIPEPPAPFLGMRPEEGSEMARQDREACLQLGKQKNYLVAILGGLLGICAVLLAVMGQYLLSGAGILLGAAALGFWFWQNRRRLDKIRRIAEKYGSGDPEEWVQRAENYRESLEHCQAEQKRIRDLRGDLDARIAALEEQRKLLCGDQTAEKVTEIWQEVQSRWTSYHNARRESDRVQAHYVDIKSMERTLERPEGIDKITGTQEQTQQRLDDTRAEIAGLQNRIGQYQGQMDGIGSKAALLQERKSMLERIGKLEDTYQALIIAQETLAEAIQELQRRFAPRIAARAQELMNTMTGGRYGKLTLGEDFSLQAGTEDENVLHSALWRSEGTVDQLYLSLRLAVAEELAPGCPLVLDDALVRFDDRRMKAALDILKTQADTRQVILFSCQNREKGYL